LLILNQEQEENRVLFYFPFIRLKPSPFRRTDLSQILQSFLGKSIVKMAENQMQVKKKMPYEIKVCCWGAVL